MSVLTEITVLVTKTHTSPNNNSVQQHNILQCKHHLSSRPSKCLLHTAVFILLLTSSNANTQRTTIEVMVIEITHSTLSCLEVLVFTESIAFWLASLSIVHKPSNYQSQTIGKTKKNASVHNWIIHQLLGVLLQQHSQIYIRPLLQNATCVWSPHYNYALDKIEAVQRKFTMRLKGCKDMEYPARLSYLHLQSLERRRLTADLILTYRIIFGLVDVCMSDYFQLMSSNGNHTRNPR